MNRLLSTSRPIARERARFDIIYQSACSSWASMAAGAHHVPHPRAEPFWAAPYFPPSCAIGRHGFPRVLKSLADIMPTAATSDEACRGAREAMANLQSGNQPRVMMSRPARQRRQTAGRARRYRAWRVAERRNSSQERFRADWRGALRSGDDPSRPPSPTTPLTQMSQGGIYDDNSAAASHATPPTTDGLVQHFEQRLYGQCGAGRSPDPVWQATPTSSMPRVSPRRSVGSERDDGRGRRLRSILRCRQRGARKAGSDVWTEAEIDRLPGRRIRPFSNRL